MEENKEITPLQLFTEANHHINNANKYLAPAVRRIKEEGKMTNEDVAAVALAVDELIVSNLRLQSMMMMALGSTGLLSQNK